MTLLHTLAAAGIMAGMVLPTGAMAGDNKTLVTGLLTKGLVKADKTYITRHVAKDYIQHNPIALDGQAGILGFVDYLKTLNPPVSIKPVRVLAEGDLVVVQSAYKLAGDKVVFDLFRVKDGKIAEHWDGIQDKPAKTVSGRSMLDGPTEITDLSETAKNKKLVVDFITDILVDGKGEKITRYIGKTYLQHNPDIGDGLDGLGKFLGYLKEKNISFSFRKIHHVVAEGNFVFSHSEGEIGGKTNAFFDLFRVKGGKIVEHWDVIQEVPTKMAHKNGMF